MHPIKYAYGLRVNVFAEVIYRPIFPYFLDYWITSVELSSILWYLSVRI